MTVPTALTGNRGPDSFLDAARDDGPTALHDATTNVVQKTFMAIVSSWAS
jgi:hypothetical protein